LIVHDMDPSFNEVFYLTDLKKDVADAIGKLNGKNSHTEVHLTEDLTTDAITLFSWMSEACYQGMYDESERNELNEKMKSDSDLVKRLKCVLTDSVEYEEWEPEGKVIHKLFIFVK